MRARWLFVLGVGSVGCGGGDDGAAGGAPDFGQRDLSALDVACEGVPGLTGQAILDQRADAFSSTLAYVTAAGDRVDPTALEVEISWPASPVATCYPAYEADGQSLAAPRVAIEGLGLKLRTADGKFDETLAAKAWLPVISGSIQFPQLLAVTRRGELRGSWQPFPEYAVTGETTLGFFSRLAGAGTANAGGNVAATSTPAAELDAFVSVGGLAVAVWPSP